MQSCLLNSYVQEKNSLWHRQQLPIWARSISNVFGVFQPPLPVQFSSWRWGQPARTFLGSPATKATLALSLGTTDIDATRMHFCCFIPCSATGKCIFSTSKSESQFQEVLVVLGQTGELCFLGRENTEDNTKNNMKANTRKSGNKTHKLCS